MKHCILFLLPIALLACLRAPAQTPAAFPGAEGFGAKATGGRGGTVLYVTTLAADGPGSLNAALSTPGKRYILFKVSGVIHATADIVEGDVTIAGQTSPGGIIVRGLIADDVYNSEGKADNIIIRHLRSRPRLYDEPAPGWILDDALRLDGASQFIADHCSFANAADETVQLSQSRDVTLQNCIIAEPLGEHYYLGGMLMNYSTEQHPQDSISVLRSVWNRVGGRMPEFSCESPFCSQQPLHVELSNNIWWDVPIQVWYNPGIDPSAEPSKDSFFVKLNLVNNYGVARSSYGGALFDHRLLEFASNSIYAAGNTLNIYPEYSNYDLFYCCNDFSAEGNHPNTDMGTATRLPQRHSYPSVGYLNTNDLPSVLGAQAGAFPRDSMDRRLMRAVAAGSIDPTPVDTGAHYFDHFALDFDAEHPPAPPTDSDSDGMPDYWETANGLNPQAQDHNGTQLSVQYTGAPGYTNVECYINRLADSLVHGTPTVVTSVFEGRTAEQLQLNFYPNPCSYTTTLHVFLARPQSIEVVLTDAIGNTVQTITTGILPTGENSVAIAPAAHLSNGVYMCRARTEMGMAGTALLTIAR